MPLEANIIQNLSAPSVLSPILSRTAHETRFIPHDLRAINDAVINVTVPKMVARIRVLDSATPMPAPPPRPVKAPSPHAQGLPPLSHGDAKSFDFSCLPIKGPSRPIPIDKLVARILNLQRILQNPAPQARRLAFYYDRLKRRKRAPVSPPAIQIKRGPAELALIAGVLPMELQRAFSAWYDTS